MNHGLLNKAYYKHCVDNFDEQLTKKNAYIDELSEYFKDIKRRDRYFIAMKAHAVELLTKLKYSTTEIGEMFNMNHSSIVHLKNKYKKMPNHDQFIVENFTKFIKDKLYPKTVLYKSFEYILVKREKYE